MKRLISVTIKIFFIFLYLKETPCKKLKDNKPGEIICRANARG